MGAPTPPADAEARRRFAAVLDRAVAHGTAALPDGGLDPTVLAAINDVARAWPRVPAALITRARTTFARAERTRVSATSPTRPVNINPPTARTPRRDPADRR